MPNMSYCRFTNTRKDMNDCLDTLCEGKRLSSMEVQAGKNLFQEILEFCQEQSIITSYDQDEIDRVFDSLKEWEDDDDV